MTITITEEDYKNSKILIIDDEIANIALLEVILEQQDYHNYRSVSDSRNAFALYEEFQPDLVLLDLRMPYLNGFQVMAEFQKSKKNSSVPIMVLTADHDFHNRVEALQQGAKDFLTKPLNPVEVSQRIRNLLEVRLMNARLQRHNSILETAVRKRTRELSETRLEIINRLGRAGEYRDNETGNHVIRIGRFSASLGKAMGLTPDHCELLLNSSPMHDIGKIGIPDSILLKPGPLDEAEWVIMKKHTLFGGEIFSGNNSDVISAAQCIALQHHEKWDGSGYPNGLKEEDISVDARIVAVCDVFDALTSIRPYKKAWPLDDALAFIEKNRGTHFDPWALDKFVGVVPEFLVIKDELTDEHVEDSVGPEWVTHKET
ncbi:MAG: response regulator [Candidatus Nitrohelix vancouverensis]|uniref:Response regulator n=1 Tax=Candidatus Nitrohelix vancouverensis TaxID=2705534 RepID=A0A7T0G4C8_9BACT|nr:MAG: response regulator [Candidatus Nitrohelix vancouverensis]